MTESKMGRIELSGADTAKAAPNLDVSDGRLVDMPKVRKAPPRPTPEQIAATAREEIAGLEKRVDVAQERIEDLRADIRNYRAEIAEWKRLLPRAKPVRKPKAPEAQGGEG